MSNHRTALVSIAADAVCILAFVAVGRRNHGEGVTLTGVAQTAGPFLVGMATGWLLSRGWRAPIAIWPTAVTVWVATITVGMALRVAVGSAAGQGSGVAWSFVLVATAATGLLLLGWRLAVRASGYPAGRRRHRSGPSGPPGAAGSR